ncbi:MAG: helix-turn-helix domain-containing protein, partial [Proteobacteria bacterium]|nr:helix-turn-helix domain-containing protein [Pseudomonadota bacterium]
MNDHTNPLNLFTDVKDGPEFIKPKDVAKRLMVSSETVYNLIRSGQLPAIRFGRTYRIYREGFQR